MRRFGASLVGLLAAPLRLLVKCWPFNLLARAVGKWRQKYQLGQRRRWTRRQRMAAGGLALLILVAGVLIPSLWHPHKAEAATWWSPSWTYRKKITFDTSTVTDSLSNFPIRVSLTAGNFTYAHAQGSGQDIRFTDADGMTPLKYEIEKWNSSGTSEIWVKVPQLDAASTTDFIYMYYGNSNAKDAQNASGVWDSKTALVQHLEETAACNVTFTDSTSNANNGACFNSGPTATTSGKIGDARTFVSTTPTYINVPDNSAFDPGTSPFTVETWVNFTNASNDSQIIDHSDSSGAFAGWDIYTNTNAVCGTGFLCFWDGATDQGLASGMSSNNTWYHVAIVRSGTTVTMYVNGSSIGTLTVGSSIPDSTDFLGLGGDNVVGNGSNLDGYMDEVRYSTTNRSAAWIKSEYLSQSNTLNTIDTESSGTYYPEGNWSYRRRVTFNNVPSSSNLSNFPVRISLSPAKGNINYNYTQSSGQDIRFVDSDGTTLLNHEIEKWNKFGTSEVWVKVPQIDAAVATDYIWMYYGNNTVPDGQAASSVWDSNTMGDWHMKETSNATLDDPTTNNFNATKLSLNEPSATTTAGQIGNAQTFDGSNDSVNVGSSLSILNNVGQATIEGWVNTNDTATTKTLVNVTANSSATNRAYLNLDSSEKPSCSGRAGDGESTQTATASAAISTGTMHHIACVINYASDTITVYVDGAAVTTTGSASFTAAATSNTASTSVTIGSYNSSNYANGTMDELRIANTGRSADWIKAEYRSGTDQMNTYALLEQNSSGPLGVWYNSCYQYRKKITINNSASSEELLNFPLHVALSSSNVTYARFKAAGADLRFTDSDGITPLNYEIEKWDTSGTSDIWVKVPAVDASSALDSIYMYYGCSSASDGQSKTNVWDSNFKGVWHLPEASGTSVADSTANTNTGTKKAAAEPNPVTGKIADAQDFDGSNDYVRVSDANSLDMTNGTMSAWIKRDVTGTYQAVFSKSDTNTSASQNYALEIRNDNKLELHLGNGVTSQVISSTSTLTSTSEWYYVTATWDGTNYAFYINGALDVSAGQGVTPTANTASLHLGEYGGNTDYLNGPMDEARISNAARSAAWIRAEYLTETNAMNSYGVEETAPATVGTDAWCSDSTGSVTCDTNWAYRRQVGLINVPSTTDLANFPVLIKLSAALGNIDYSKTQNNGEDIRFTDPADPSTVLPYEIEKWDESGTSYVWVKVPVVSGTMNSDYLYMYYGNASASDGQDATNVWDSNTKAVWHLKESPASTCSGAKEACDSTINANHADANGSMTGGSQVSGQIDGSLSFNGTSQYLAAPTSSSLGITTNITISSWIKRTTTSRVEGILAKTDNTAWDYDLFVCDNANFGGGHNNKLCFFSNALSGPHMVSTGTITDTNWHHVAVTRSGTTLAFYIDGAASGTVTVGSTAFGNNAFDVLIAADQTFAEYLSGGLDELRLADTARSADWIRAEYTNGLNTMATFSPEETGALPPPTLTAISSQSTNGLPVFQLRGYDPLSPSYLRYKIEVCSDSACSSIVRTIDQTSSQTGWSGQDSQTSTAYVASSTLSSSTLATHTYQASALSGGQYWWRAYAIDPSGDNTWSAASAISSFQVSATPAAPTLIEPASAALVPQNPVFKLYATDANSDDVQYKIQVCSVSDCSVVVRTIDETSSQTGWSGQNAASSTAYGASSSLSSSTVAVHTYQAPALTAATQYWWRAYAIDPSGSNTFSSASSIDTFTTRPVQVKVQGGTTIKGGTRIGN